MLSTHDRSPSRKRSINRIDLYRLLSDEGRLQILALCAEEELSVGELSQLLDSSQPQISRKAAPLRDAGLLGSRRDGTRTWLKATPAATDAVVSDALEEGRRLCTKDGSFAKLPGLVAVREARGQELFQEVPSDSAPSQVGSVHLAHLAALSPLLPSTRLAVDVGTGEGVVLDVLAPLFKRVLAVDRSPAQLARCARRVAERGFHHVSLLQGSPEDVAVLERVHSAGGADLVFASRVLHHASRPGQVILSLVKLLAPSGHLIVVDYLPHEKEQMREEQGDVWLGLSPKELSEHFLTSGLDVLATLPIPAAFHRGGPDEQLSWHAVVGRKRTKDLSQPAVHNPRA
jgi:ArsR family transcriptional regulator